MNIVRQKLDLGQFESKFLFDIAITDNNDSWSREMAMLHIINSEF